jgi:hypothetical protein
MAGYLRALDSFVAAVADDKGVSKEMPIYAGQVVSEDHPAVLMREHLFEPLDEATERGRGRRKGPQS